MGVRSVHPRLKEVIITKREKLADLRSRFSEVAETHPFEIGLSIALALFGIRALLTNLQTAPGSIQELPDWLAVTYCILSVLGGGSVVFGVFYANKLSWAYGFELLGLFVSSAAWASYVVGLLFSPITGRSTLLISALIALVIACLLRARKLKKKARAELDALRFVNQEGPHA